MKSLHAETKLKFSEHHFYVPYRLISMASLHETALRLCRIG
jgi:hypothetical protein